MNEIFSTTVARPEQSPYVKPVSRGQLAQYVREIAASTNEEANIHGLEAEGIAAAAHRQTLTESQIESRDYHRARATEMAYLARAAAILELELNPPRQADDSDEVNSLPVDAAELEGIAERLASEAVPVKMADNYKAPQLQSAADLAHSMAVRYDEVVTDINRPKNVTPSIDITA
ncbi:MAG: hypothetical protein WBP26_05445 [Candidatus Saccharimonadales bacterium]